MPDPNQNPEETLDWLLKKQKERRLTIQEQALLEQLMNLLSEENRMAPLKVVAKPKLILGSKPDWDKILNFPYDIGLGVSGVITKDGEIAFRMSMNIKLLDIVNAKLSTNKIDKNSLINYFGELPATRQGSHDRLVEELLKVIKISNDDPLYAFALNLKKGTDNTIEIGFFSGSVNHSRKANQKFKITQSNGHPAHPPIGNNDRKAGILKREYQDIIIENLQNYFGSRYKIVRKVDEKGGAGRYW